MDSLATSPGPKSFADFEMGVSKNNGTPKSSILIVSIINHPFWGTPIFGNTQIPGMTSTAAENDSSNWFFGSKN